jgi:hypothetical protein
MKNEWHDIHRWMPFSLGKIGKLPMDCRAPRTPKEDSAVEAA